MGHNHRYEAYYDRLTDARRIEADRLPVPITLPKQAYGPNALEFARDPPPVWAWIPWTEGPQTRVACYAVGWNDRVVLVRWLTSGGDRSTTVWRQAVARRTERKHSQVLSDY